MIYLITGGSGSGKSAFAEELVETFHKEKRYYIATMKPFGEEIRQKILRHQKMRSTKHFTSVECYTGLKGDLVPDKCVVLLECISNLVANEMFETEGAKENTVQVILDGINQIAKKAEELVIVTNEVFSDGVLYGADMEQYLANLGEMNQKLANMADQVIEVVYAIPIYHKREVKK